MILRESKLKLKPITKKKLRSNYSRKPSLNAPKIKITNRKRVFFRRNIMMLMRLISIQPELKKYRKKAVDDLPLHGRSWLTHTRRHRSIHNAKRTLTIFRTTLSRSNAILLGRFKLQTRNATTRLVSENSWNRARRIYSVELYD